MQLDDLVTAKDRQMRLPWWRVLCVIFGSMPLILLFYYFGKPALALPVLGSAGIVTMAIALRWQLRRHVWFWVIIGIFVALHGALILVVPWTTQWVPAVVMTPIGVADLYLMLAILSVVRKLAKGPKASER
jgi:drug/metabolite transporter (DMT)-like permease